MGLNKKQKKQLEVARKKLDALRPRVAGCKEQNDDPEELRKLEEEVEKYETIVRELKAAK